MPAARRTTNAKTNSSTLSNAAPAASRRRKAAAAASSSPSEYYDEAFSILEKAIEYIQKKAEDIETQNLPFINIEFDKDVTIDERIRVACEYRGIASTEWYLHVMLYAFSDGNVYPICPLCLWYSGSETPKGFTYKNPRVTERHPRTDKHLDALHKFLRVSKECLENRESLKCPECGHGYAAERQDMLESHIKTCRGKAAEAAARLEGSVKPEEEQPNLSEAPPSPSAATITITATHQEPLAQNVSGPSSAAQLPFPPSVPSQPRLPPPHNAFLPHQGIPHSPSMVAQRAMAPLPRRVNTMTRQTRRNLMSTHLPPQYPQQPAFDFPGPAFGPSEYQAYHPDHVTQTVNTPNPFVGGASFNGQMQPMANGYTHPSLQPSIVTVHQHNSYQFAAPPASQSYTNTSAPTSYFNVEYNSAE